MYCRSLLVTVSSFQIQAQKNHADYSYSTVAELYVGKQQKQFEKDCWRPQHMSTIAVLWEKKNLRHIEIKQKANIDV